MSSVSLRSVNAQLKDLDTPSTCSPGSTFHRQSTGEEDVTPVMSMMRIIKSAPDMCNQFHKRHNRIDVHQQSFGDRLSEKLESLLLNASTEDLDALTNVRNLLHAKCLELEEQKKLASVIKILPVPLVDDGDQAAPDLKVIADWSVGRFLGQGRYATVYQVKNQCNGRSEAMKVISKSKWCADGDRSSIINEYEALQKVSSHRHISGFRGALKSKKQPLLVYGLCKRPGVV